jgi:nicotinamide riboside transporter PnuC
MFLMPIIVIWCVGKIGSFGFACVSACALGAKPNVPMCGGNIFIFFYVFMQQKFHCHSVGCLVFYNAR